MQQIERSNSYPLQEHGWIWIALCLVKYPGGKRQIPYDLTYKWNLINKTNKQANYNQRYCIKEQSDTNQRGGGRV